MLVALSDTHGDTDPRLTDHLRDTIEDASLVVHAGDFTTADVLDAFDSLAPAFAGVAGNSDSSAVRDRLPEKRVVEQFGRRFLVVHGHRHDRTSLSLLARQEKADVVVLGHTHSAGVEYVGDVTVVNPGSHADPRGEHPTFATFRESEAGIRVHVWRCDGQPCVVRALGQVRE